jgi:hypothetical protein
VGNPHRQRNLARIKPLVQMVTPLEQQDLPPLKTAGDQLSGMTLNLDRRKTGDIAVINVHRILDLIGKTAQTRTENHGQIKRFYPQTVPEVCDDT